MGIFNGKTLMITANWLFWQSGARRFLDSDIRKFGYSAAMRKQDDMRHEFVLDAGTVNKIKFLSGCAIWLRSKRDARVDYISCGGLKQGLSCEFSRWKC